MRIEEKDVGEITKILSQNFSKGDRWAAWEETQEPTHPLAITAFKNIKEASSYCEDNIDYLSDELRRWCFKPITNLLKSINGASSKMKKKDRCSKIR